MASELKFNNASAILQLYSNEKKLYIHNSINSKNSITDSILNKLGICTCIKIKMTESHEISTNYQP